MLNDKVIENKNISNPYDIVNEYYMNQNLNIKSNEKFIDNLFPPNEQSLFSKNAKGIQIMKMVLNLHQ